MHDFTYRSMQLLWMVLFISALPATADENVIQSEQQTAQEETKRNQKRLSMAGYPVVLYTPETSLIFGGGAAMTIRDQNRHRNTRPDNLNFYAIYTLKNQSAVLFNPDIYFD
ncbi:MAG TPA: hypothetical protein ENN22_11725 [bacterium]|nr:hypothetical protein [bacterium]